MRESDTAIRRYVTKPRVFHEAIHFRAREGTKVRIDALRGEARQGDFVRVLIEEALERRRTDDSAVIVMSWKSFRKALRAIPLPKAGEDGVEQNDDLAGLRRYERFDEDVRLWFASEEDAVHFRVKWS